MKESKIFFPFVPSLLHLAVVKEAMNLYNSFHIQALDEAFSRMTSEESKNYPEQIECNSPQKMLLRIPPPLRKRVMEAVHGMNCGVQLWKREHSSILKIDEGECIFYRRCDGTIDTVQTARQMVLNSNIHITNRFNLACMYCLEESIQTMWTEMEATGQTENHETVRLLNWFWVEWLRDGCRVDWMQATIKHLWFSYPARRFSSFFPFLRPEERKQFLSFFFLATHDDLRLCLYSMTQAEEEKLLNLCPDKVLLIFLRWPMRSLFFEMAERIWKYLDESAYLRILDHLLNRIDREVFDFYDFFANFWKCSPSHLRERAGESSFKEKIDSCFNEMKRKREADCDDLRNYKYKKIDET